MSQLLDDLKASREALAARKWIQGRYFLPGSGFVIYDTSGCCAVGAIRLGTGVVHVDTGEPIDLEDERYHKVRRFVAGVLGEDEADCANGTITHFNDLVETKEEVLALFDAAIAAAVVEEAK